MFTILIFVMFPVIFLKKLTLDNRKDFLVFLKILSNNLMAY